MNREKFAWVTSVVLIGLLAFQIPGTLAHRDDDYRFVATLMDIHRQVADNYAEPVDEDKLRQGMIDGMLSQLDPFTVYVPPAEQPRFNRLLEGTFEGVGIQLDQDKKTGEILVVSPIEGSPAIKAGVLAGDVILKVNGEEIAGLRLDEVIKKVAGPLGSEVRLTVRHTDGEQQDLAITRTEIILPTVKGYRRNPDDTWDYYVHRDPDVAYVRVTQFTPETFAKLKAAAEQLLAEGMQGLILDLRFNPGGRLDQAKDVVDLFVEKGTIIVTKGRNRPEEVTSAKAEGTLPDFPMAVLVNEHSASASEIVAGSLMDNRRALVIGTRTYGKGSVQELIPLDGKSGELKLTVAYYYLPSGRLVHRKKDAADWGVEPQIKVEMDEKTQERVLQEMSTQELFRPKPAAAAKATTGDVKPATPPDRNPAEERPKTPDAGPEGAPAPATPPADTQPTTQPAGPPADAQLDAAISTMIGHIVLRGERATAAASQPAEAPTPARQ